MATFFPLALWVPRQTVANEPDLSCDKEVKDKVEKSECVRNVMEDGSDDDKARSVATTVLQ